MTDTKRIQQYTDSFRGSSANLAERVDRVAAAVGTASTRLGRKIERLTDALADANQDAEGPGQRVAKAVDDLALEAKRSFAEITRPPRKPWWRRFAFWR
jgi:hypothetical protein